MDYYHENFYENYYYGTNIIYSYQSLWIISIIITIIG
jgi:hypothetical protein